MVTISRRGLAAASFAALAGAQAAQAAPKLSKPSPEPDATEIAMRIRRGEMSAAEAVEAAIARAEALQPALNFMVTSDFDRALDKVKAGAPPGPFSGVPFLIKDLEDYAGLPTRLGSRSGRLNPPAARQSPYVDAFDRAGLVVIGKSATPEFGFLPSTEPLATGPTRNPWDPRRSAGGSSGGAAAAVASGVVAVAHATDGGGSIRIPAANCGLFGLKPSRGRMIGARDEVRIADISVNHVLSRSVRDSAALFAATEDASPGARYAPVGLITAPLRRRLRIGLLVENGLGQPPGQEVLTALERAAKLLQSLGHHVEPAQWPIDGRRFGDDFLLLWASGADQIVRKLAETFGREPDEQLLEPFTLGLAQVARKTPPEAMAAALERLRINALAYDTWFPAHQFDVVLSPVVSATPPVLGNLAPTAPFETLVERLMAYVGYTPVHNVAGAPAMSVPLGWTEGALPVGMMFAARAGQERVLFELAYQLEAAQPWSQWRPVVHA